jgi:IS1 family transposase
MGDRNASHFYYAWERLSELAIEAYTDYTTAYDVVSLVPKPSFNNPLIDNRVIVAQFEIYNILNQRLRFYLSRYETLQEAADMTFNIWLQLTKEDKSGE